MGIKLVARWFSWMELEAGYAGLIKRSIYSSRFLRRR